jgi:excisionase family DNA binding protein
MNHPTAMANDEIPDVLGVKMLTVPEIAAVLRVSKMTVYRLIKTGALESVQVRGAYRVPESAVKTLLSTKTARAGRPVKPPQVNFCPPEPAVRLGAWLRDQRTRRGYSVADMGGRLRTAGTAEGYHMPSAPLMSAYVRLYEHGHLVPVGHHHDLYCQVLGIPDSQFGP